MFLKRIHITSKIGFLILVAFDECVKGAKMAVKMGIKEGSVKDFESLKAKTMDSLIFQLQSFILAFRCYDDDHDHV